MINQSNPAFERPETIFRKCSHFDIETQSFSGKASYDGHVGGFPMMFNRETRSLAVDASDQHTICFGASGSKKTRAVVMPAIRVLGCAGESMIINDTKGELFERTAGFLQKAGYRVVALNFRDPSVGSAWNPLFIPYLYYKQGDVNKAAEFVSDVATTLTLSEMSAAEPYWDYAAFDTCCGLILLLFRYCRENGVDDSMVNIGNLLALRRALFSGGTNPKNSRLWLWAREDELIAAHLSGCVNTADVTRDGILGVLDQKLSSLAIAPTLLDMLANNNFSIEDIGNSKTAVFLITPDEKTTFHRLVALFISQSYQQLIHSVSKTGGRVRNRVNFILDEFSSLPAIGSDFASYISAARSRNIRFLIVVQSKNQLVRRYKEEAATITANCTNWIVLFSRELDLLREISELCGEKKDRTPNVSVYDLQHFDKDKNEALLLFGRQKPCVVELLDIDRFGDRKYTVADFETPERKERVRMDSFRLPDDADAQQAAAHSDARMEEIFDAIRRRSETKDQGSPAMSEAVRDVEAKLSEIEASIANEN